MHSAAFSTTASVSSPMEVSRRRTRVRPIVRRPTREQGIALEVLGHAIEYIMDSRMNFTESTPEDAAAIRLMIAASQQVFSECALHIPLHRRMKHWAKARLLDSRR